MIDRLLTLPEVAVILRCPEQTIRYWRGHGHGPRSFKIGRRVCYRESDVQAWINAQMNASSMQVPA